jgi:hypothetical protein
MENGEEYFGLTVESFESPNKDVENFLKTKAVQATKLNTATTYLIYIEKNPVEFDLVGYFSLAMKMLTLKKTSLSKTSERVISRFGYYDEDSNSYKVPAVLVAQFGRNFNANSTSISGTNLMAITLKQVQNVLSFLSGKTVFLECEKEQKLIDFYKSNGFSVLDNEILSKDKKELMQLYRLL